MALVTTKKLLKDAQNKGYAIGHFNTSNLEITKAIVKAAERMDSPVIIATTKTAIDYAGIEEIACIVRTIAKKAKVKIALHLDHSPSFSLVKQCISNGWTSVMMDASYFPFEKNVKITKRTTDYAHKRSIPIEAEIGVLQQAKDLLTDPDEAKRFVKLTKCDSLAIAIGTSHGAYKFKDKPKLDFKRLKEIREQANIPLVLHGASSVPKDVIKLAQKYGAKLGHSQGVPKSQIKKAIKLGICKINVDTDLRLAFDAAVRQFIVKNPKIFDPRKILESAIDKISNVVCNEIKILGSRNKN